MLLRCRDSGAWIFHPRVAEPATGSRNLEWAEASGEGVVYATTVMRKRPPQPSYNVALIDLAEGPRMMSRVEGVPPEEVTIGMRVKARIAEEDGAPLVVFDPV
ncbi:MAG: Zn-ribbon domain-containing OB-fold protein [Pseudomonadota bacterium]